VRLTLVHDSLPAVLRLALDKLLTAAILAFGIVLGATGYDYVARTVGQVSAAVGYPIEALHLAAPVCGGLIALHGLARLFAPADAAAVRTTGASGLAVLRGILGADDPARATVSYREAWEAAA